jgi:hypothetical protein
MKQIQEVTTFCSNPGIAFKPEWTQIFLAIIFSMTAMKMAPKKWCLPILSVLKT